ncbi:GNAT family N-acetyltransferase [Paenibacillus oceani]|uniref:GNAT family N-acetyltransferase n=1 Tax=Paenibacillus oceani TaxID=2772510 RepID=A0A927GZM6_9BACL|nr:GNAT family N-acetyltransferase [Paenibacillus oceani]MBD2862805.1 GNAT family N-acetyltransferase [Paenibacillus oceani]
MNIRLLNDSDAQVYREVRLRALKNDPDAFGSTYEQEETKPLEHIIERIHLTKDQFTLGCFDDSNTLVGIVNFSRENRLKTAHKGNIYGMYVEPQFRGRGVGKALISALIERAANECEGLEQIHLTVVSANKSAKRLYVSLGFEVYGIEPRALKFDEQYYDEDLMILRL